MSDIECIGTMYYTMLNTKVVMCTYVPVETVSLEVEQAHFDEFFEVHMLMYE